MKKILFTFLFSLVTIIGNANITVTKFLGIPVDGTKTEMIQKLKVKGFTYDIKNDRLIGDFNGIKSNIRIITNKGKVCRIYICDESTYNEADIRIRFNTLLRQFENNENYEASPVNEYIDEDEDISYEMTCNNKRYEAVFYQKSKEDKILLKPNWDKLVMRSVWFMIAEYYGKYYLAIYYDNEYNRAQGEDL